MDLGRDRGRAERVAVIVSVWVRDVRFDPKPRHRPIFRNPSSLHLAKLAQIEEMNAIGVERIGVLSDEAFLAAGVALYAGEGSKWKGCAKFAGHGCSDGSVHQGLSAGR